MTIEEVGLKQRMERSSAMYKALQETCDNTIRESRGDLSGFAVVAWESDGSAISSFKCDRGMVSRSLVPAFVHDVLNRRVAMEIAEENSGAL